MKQKKIKKIQKFFLSVALALALVFSPISAPKTNAFWGEFVQEIFHFGMQKITDLISDMSKGMAKQSAVKMLNGQVDRLMGGTGQSGAAFITNFEDYLVSQSVNESTVYINDYVSQMTTGRNSLTGYRSEGFAGAKNYAASLSTGALEKIKNSQSVPKITYEGQPEQMFEDGSFKNYNLWASGINNPWGFDAAVSGEYLKKLEEKKEIQKTKAIAYQGFTGTSGEDSTITYPGILTKENVANVQNIPNQILAQANGPGEILTSVVNAMLAKIEKGFSSVNRVSQSQTTVQNRMNSYTNSSVNQSGPEARFQIEGN